MLKASTQAEPSADTFSLNASDPTSPNSARPEKASEKNTDAVFAALSLEICSRASPLPPSATAIAVSSAALDLMLSRLGELADVLMPTWTALSNVTGRLRWSRHCVPSNTKTTLSATDQTHQPARGTRNAQAPSCQVAIALPCPAHAPVAPAATTWRSPSAGEDGGEVRVRSSTATWIAASRIRNASLCVTCFCAWLPSMKGSPRFGVSVMMCGPYARNDCARQSSARVRRHCASANTKYRLGKSRL